LLNAAAMRAYTPVIAAEILEQVRTQHQHNHYRPYVNPNANVDDNLITLMEACWVEDPKARPDFSGIAVLFTSFGKRGCVLSTLYHIAVGIMLHDVLLEI